MAQDKTLRWKRLDVTAHLDADGRMHVEERHTIVFNGDWNGGERTFRNSLENQLELEQIARVDGTNKLIPLRKDPKLRSVDTYGWHGNNNLRWRSRAPSDPPFENKDITYVIDYTDGYILVPQGNAAQPRYLLDHNFGLPDLQYPIDEYALVFSIDPAWQPATPRHIVRTDLPHGQNETITQLLTYTGAGTPSAVNTGVPEPVRYRLLLALVAAAAFFVWAFIGRERALGRLQPLADPSTIDRRWLEENLFKFAPEVVGAAWDDRTGAAEVASVLARLVQEGKMRSQVEKHGLFKSDELVLTLLRDRSAFQDYERALIDALFIDGDTTSTSKIKEHYKKSGFDPVSKIKKPLQQKIKMMGRQGDGPKIPRRPTMLMVVAAMLLLVIGSFFSPLNILGAVFSAVAILVFYVFGLIGAIDYRRRLTNLGFASLEFAIPGAVIVIVPALLLGGVIALRFSVFTLAGVALLALAAVRSLLNLAKTRDGADRLENRRRLAAAREFFLRELQKPAPALDDAWFPYVLAFGLGANVDRWFRAWSGNRAAGMATSNSSTTSSTSSSGSGMSWTGGGGAFGGAGASGTWAVAAAGMAAGVAAPSSGGSGGGGGGGSSGGGGGGGW